MECPPVPSTDPVAVIRQCPIFGHVGMEGLARLGSIAQWRRFERQQMIAHANDEPAGMYIVAEGQVRVFKLAPNGKEHVLHLAMPGQSFMEVAVLGDFPAPAFCQAVEDSRCVLLPAVCLRQLLREDHQLCLDLLAGLSEWVRHLVGLLEDIVLRDATSRLARHLLAAYHDQGERVELPSLKKDLASHLNLTSETLSRSLRRLSEAGLIDRANGAAVHITDPQGLASAAEGVFPEL